jgi:hypothetical protein
MIPAFSGPTSEFDSSSFLMEQRLEEEPYELPQSHVVFRVPVSAKSLAYARGPWEARSSRQPFRDGTPSRNGLPLISPGLALRITKDVSALIRRGGGPHRTNQAVHHLMVRRESQSTRLSPGIFTNHGRLPKLSFSSIAATDLWFLWLTALLIGLLF